MISKPTLACLSSIFATAIFAGEMPNYEKHHLTGAFWAEGATFADLNKDGQTDAIAGPIWYTGPDFKERHEIYPAKLFDPLAYSDNFFAFPYDFNRDGWTDILVLGFPGKNATWYKNPGDTVNESDHWIPNNVFDGVDNESPTFGDVLGNGQPALICNHDKTFGYATFDPEAPEKAWTYHPITPKGEWGRFYHGLGWGDINGDGRADILDNNGWWEQPASLAGNPLWKRHAANFGDGGSQMHVDDVNGDGLADVITAIQAHGYGISWFEQSVSKNGDISWQEHPITSRDSETQLEGVQFSQPHAIAHVDLDGDGLKDIVTGKRWWAHGSHGDPEPNGDPVIYAFLLRREDNRSTYFEPKLIDDASGVGTQLIATDANGDGQPDFISANKRGTFVFMSQATTTAATVTLPLWPGTPPGETKQLPPEADTTGPDGNLVAGRTVIRLGNVSQPTLTVYRPDPALANGTSVIVAPGGGYHILALDLEGTEVCEWLNSLGITAVLLKYRVPHREGVEQRLPPLQDMQRTIGLVRAHAADWEINPERIGVLGFSAGAHLSAAASNHFETLAYPAIDDADKLSHRPDFAVLIYPGYLKDPDQSNKLNPSLHVTADTPPTLLVMAQDDPVDVNNTLVYYAALNDAGVPAALHLYPTGGHGYGLRHTANPVTSWPDRVSDWLKANDWLGPVSDKMD